MTLQKSKGKRGGKRPGAGRPSTLKDPVRFLVTFERTEIDALELQLAASDVSCASLSAYLGDTVQCSAAHADSVATVSWSEGGNPIGDEQPQLQLSLLELRNYVLTLEVCDVEEACAQSDEVTVEVLARLFIPAKSEVGLSGQLLLVNRSPRPTAWDAETVGWLTVVPSRGVLGGQEEVTLTIDQAASAPAGPSEVVLSFTAGPSDDLLLPAGSVAVSVASRPPPTLALPAHFVRQDPAAGAGVPTLRLKLLATTISGALMGAAGAPYPFYVTYVDPASAFNLSYAVNAVAMPMIGGTAAWLGPVVGALLLGTLQQVATVTISSELNLLMVGLVLVAVGTSLPEVATVLTAARRGETDLVLGNIVGSNIFNTVAVLGITATIRPLPSQPSLMQDVAAMFVFSLMAYLVTIHGRKVVRREGIMLLAMYVAYVAFAISRG